MYDSHINNRKYNDFRSQIGSLMNSKIVKKETIDKLELSVYYAYQDGHLSSTQYDKLMSYIADMRV